MIHIRSREKKRTWYHITYVYDYDGKTYKATHKISSKLYETLSDQQIRSRVRAAADRERAKKTKSINVTEEKVEEKVEE